MITPLPRHSKTIERVTCLDGETVVIGPHWRYRAYRLYVDACQGFERRQIIGKDGKPTKRHRRTAAEMPNTPIKRCKPREAAGNGRTRGEGDA